MQGVNGRKYFDSNLNLKDPKNGEYNARKFEIVNQLVLNECYLKNFDKYKYVAAFDIDETVLPKKTKLFTIQKETDHVVPIGDIFDPRFITAKLIFDNVQCNRYENMSKNSNSNDLELFLNEVSDMLEHNRTEPESFYFTHAFYLRNDLVSAIFQAFFNYKNSENEPVTSESDYQSSLPRPKYPR